MSESIYLGSDIKVLVEMTAPGFSMVDDDWSVSLKSGGKTLVTREKAECIQDEEGKFYALFRASELRAGKIDIVFDAKVPDADWDDGIRNEVDKKSLATILKI